MEERMVPVDREYRRRSAVAKRPKRSCEGLTKARDLMSLVGRCV
jgi:hypothetical protein